MLVDYEQKNLEFDALFKELEADPAPHALFQLTRNPTGDIEGFHINAASEMHSSIKRDLYSDMKEMYRSRWTSRALLSRLIACRMSLSWEMSVPKEHAATINRRTQYTCSTQNSTVDMLQKRGKNIMIPLDVTYNR
jgi:hypothetical protein